MVKPITIPFCTFAGMKLAYEKWLLDQLSMERIMAGLREVQELVDFMYQPEMVITNVDLERGRAEATITVPVPAPYIELNLVV